ncbi:MAG: putative dual-specificity RNA methyltransferase RlmN [Anaerolinea thermophila]|uniref:Probable dual-specificity RNA methyltransferase RlmN n=1 Tax=Anaerolinea thermophila TaxID=167964 RepID=A0A101FYG6_9CHLR|nr:MAG: putative dual-specificity RNA methyltransferase RlmN [Anaerolinea thermophila]
MESILDLNKEQLITYLQSIRQPAYRWKQIWHGLYVEMYDSWLQFTNLPLELRGYLQEHFTISNLSLADHIHSSDGSTEKVLFSLPDGNPIETVLMEYEERISICVSSQSGCSIGCKFCATGKLGLLHNISCGEMLAQVLHFARASNQEKHPITNIVIMGMGEPLLNYAEVKKAIEILNDHDGLNIGSRHITLSTIGIPEQILQFAYDFPQLNLAVSLHAANDQQRDKLIPINKKYNIAMLLEAVKQYIALTNRRVTFEYVLIADQNDAVSDALQLGSILHGLLCHVNLIPLNPTAHFNGNPPPLERIEKFQQVLNDHHIPATIRFSKGTQIQAGCGQLAGKSH